MDELLSGEELLHAAQEDMCQRQRDFRTWILGLVDMSAAMLFLLPLFRQTVNGQIQAVSLRHLTQAAPYMRGLYLALTGVLAVWGLVSVFWNEKLRGEWRAAVSLLLHGASVLVFIGGSQPYAAALLFVLLMIKVLLLIKKR